IPSKDTTHRHTTISVNPRLSFLFMASCYFEYSQSSPRRFRMSRHLGLTRSEIVLQGKLDLPQLTGPTNPAETGGRSHTSRSPTCARTVPRRVVGRVEHFHPELDGMLFGDPE